MKTQSPIDKANASHRKAFNRLQEKYVALDAMNNGRKAQIARWDSLFKKLLKEGRITKEELKQYTPVRKK